MYLAYVLIQVALLREGAVTELADERLAALLRLVYVHVRAQVGAIGERLAAAVVLAHEHTQGEGERHVVRLRVLSSHLRAEALLE